jgi:hypothetical protein
MSRHSQNHGKISFFSLVLLVPLVFFVPSQPSI